MPSSGHTRKNWGENTRNTLFSHRHCQHSVRVLRHVRDKSPGMSVNAGLWGGFSVSCYSKQWECSTEILHLYLHYVHMLWTSLRPLWSSLGGGSCMLAGTFIDGEVNLMILTMDTWANSAHSASGLWTKLSWRRGEICSLSWPHGCRWLPAKFLGNH